MSGMRLNQSTGQLPDNVKEKADIIKETKTESAVTVKNVSIWKIKYLNFPIEIFFFPKDTSNLLNYTYFWNLISTYSTFIIIELSRDESLVVFVK